MTEVIKVEDCNKNIGDYDIPIHNAIIIPDGATNGDMIMAMFPNAKANVFVKEVGVKGLDTYSTFTKKWWNAPYNPPKQNLAPADKSGLGYADQPTLQSAT